jgi:hypothetical protein
MTSSAHAATIRNHKHGVSSDHDLPALAIPFTFIASLKCQEEEQTSSTLTVADSVRYSVCDSVLTVHTLTCLLSERCSTLVSMQPVS